MYNIIAQYIIFIKVRLLYQGDTIQHIQQCRQRQQGSYHVYGRGDVCFRSEVSDGIVVYVKVRTWFQSAFCELLSNTCSFLYIFRVAIHDDVCVILFRFFHHLTMLCCRGVWMIVTATVYKMSTATVNRIRPRVFTAVKGSCVMQL